MLKFIWHQVIFFSFASHIVIENESSLAIIKLKMNGLQNMCLLHEITYRIDEIIRRLCARDRFCLAFSHMLGSNSTENGNHKLKPYTRVIVIVSLRNEKRNK